VIETGHHRLPIGTISVGRQVTAIGQPRRFPSSDEQPLTAVLGHSAFAPGMALPAPFRPLTDAALIGSVGRIVA
jgi:hypothetical protein